MDVQLVVEQFFTRLLACFLVLRLFVRRPTQIHVRSLTYRIVFVLRPNTIVQPVSCVVVLQCTLRLWQCKFNALQLAKSDSLYYTNQYELAMDFALLPSLPVCLSMVFFQTKTHTINYKQYKSLKSYTTELTCICPMKYFQKESERQLRNAFSLFTCPLIVTTVYL